MKKLLLTISVIAICSLSASATVNGDVNGDGDVTSADVTELYNFLLNDDSSSIVNGDVNGDGDITSADITCVYDILLGNDIPDEPVIEYTVNGITFKMIRVDEGSFMMGSYSTTVPGHKVNLSTYYIGETEVTQELWVAVMVKNPSYFNGNGDPDLPSAYHPDVDYGVDLQRPVEQINYPDCLEFITKLNELTGATFRLPTEAEWEFAARGGNLSHNYVYAGSENIDEVAWYRENLPSSTALTPGWNPQPVATKLPNELGIYDMTGNVNEWCYNWYGPASQEEETNPTGPETGTQRTFRGGAFSSYAVGCRIINPGKTLPDNRGNTRGLRLAM